VNVVGVDGCRSGWVAVHLSEGRFAQALFCEDFAGIVERAESAAVIAVDIPIGLPTAGKREADAAARAFLGRGASSVFSTPPRQVLEAETYQAARAVARRLGGPGVSSQSYALRAKILEVEPIAAADRRIHEVHPEVSFRAMAGQAMSASKKTWNGLQQRRRLLERAGIRLPDEVGEAGRRAGPDDLLDAAAAAWSAIRIGSGQGRSLPDPPETGLEDRPMAIWY
jgi:predicted RNase H-like nuclease